MSSTLSKPKRKPAASPVAIPPAVAAAPAMEAERDEHEFAQFVRAVVIGVLVGVPLVWAMIVGTVKVAAPDMEFGSIAGIALWVAIWTGMFLGGTVTVGMLSSRQHKHR